MSFRDYVADGEAAMMTSDFFTLPQEEQSLKECVSLIQADGGGDTPEDGLEALAYAMRSKWVATGVKKRHVIVLWTDAPTHDIGYGATSASYPAGMPASFDELSRWWNDVQEGGVMNRNAKRLILFAPDAPAWNRISASWDQTIHVHTLSEGLTEIDYQQVLDVVGNSI